MKFEDAISQLQGLVESRFAVMPLAIIDNYARYIIIIAAGEKYKPFNMSGSTTTYQIVQRELNNMYARLAREGLTIYELYEELPNTSQADGWMVFDDESFVRWHNRRIST